MSPKLQTIYQFPKIFVGLAPHITVMTRITLLKKLDERRKNLKCLLKQLLASQKYLCATADAWSTSGKGYLGVTVHWISSTFIRESAALACCRLRGAHTYDVIGKALHNVFNEYEISVDAKIVYCITDNGSNFLKAFREFGISYGNSGSENTNTELENADDDDEYESVQELQDYDFEVTSIDNATAASELEADGEFGLPPHHPCSTHTLSLIAVIDSQNALKGNATFKKLHNSTMAKCSALWNTCSRSLKNCEVIEKIAKRRLVKPCPTRWNSLYDSLVVLHEIHMKSSLKAICQAVDVAVFKDAEIEFLTEYITVLRPVAIALDRLQGSTAESNAFMGFLLPTLLKVKQSL
jgi:hypothetical protein